MTEKHIGHLCKAAASLPNKQSSRSLTLLRSFYLMRCKEITSDNKMFPDRLFSPKVRCSHCCTEWRSGTPTTLRSIKLSKRQRQRIRSLKSKGVINPYVRSRLELLQGKEMEQQCDFCKHSTVRTIKKPEKVSNDLNTKMKEENIVSVTPMNEKSIAKTKATLCNKSQSKQKKKQKKVNKKISVYSTAKDVYSLNQVNNTLTASVKEEPKVIKNNKKKKDKFAGLCAKAVLASAKFKEEKEKQNKLSLFLKPSI